jgi:addiction module RelE/StbE family toxin
VTVSLTRVAQDDIAAIYSYYAERNYEHAERAVRAILAACYGLADFPLIGKQGKLAGTRERLVTRYPYRIVYRVRGDTIRIARVLHQRQNWPSTA